MENKKDFMSKSKKYAHVLLNVNNNIIIKFLRCKMVIYVIYMIITLLLDKGVLRKYNIICLRLI